MISICITSKGDGDLLNKTITYFYRKDIEYVIVLDYDLEYPDLSEFDNIDNIKIIKSDIPLGSSLGKQLAVDSSSGDIIMILDGHMRPISTNWFEMINDLCIDDGIYFSRTHAWNPIDDIIDQVSSSGCYLNTFPNNTENSITPYCDDRDKEYYPICMGACYIMKRSWWNKINGFKELSGYGAEELLISLKSWGLGGFVKLLPELHMAHVYRNTLNAIKGITIRFMDLSAFIDNHLVSIFSLMDDEDEELMMLRMKSLNMSRGIFLNPSKFSKYDEYKSYYSSLGYDYSRFKSLNKSFLPVK